MTLSNEYMARISLMILLSLSVIIGHAQTKVIMGVIRDGHSDERIPFASVQFKKSRAGKLSDSAGNFIFRFQGEWPKDSLQISYVGFVDYTIPLNDSLFQKWNKDTIKLIVLMERGKYDNEVVVRQKVDFGLLLWRKIVKHKPFNDRYRFQNFSYELYNKLELDINRINKERLNNVKLLKPFSFILDNVDTTEGPPFLPVFLTETISNYYFEKDPTKRREVIKGSKTLGLDNESVSKMLGGMEQNVDFYNNFIPVFDKRFVSPLSNNGDYYYRYKIVDTEFVNQRRLLHMIFTPKRKGENTFEGDCWVHDTSFAIQKMNLRLDASANLNYIDQMSLIQEFELINDSVWFLTKDKFVVNLSILSKKSAGFIGRKTTTYRNIVINNPSVTAELDKNKIMEELIMEPEAREKADTFWLGSRHEDLNKNEKAVYQMIDTLLKMPLFKTYTNIINFVGTGYLDIGKFEIGPWYNWIYANELQGFRLRFDLGTNRYFSKNVILHGYLAYGFGDQVLRGEGDVLYMLKKNPRLTIFGMYRNDLDYNQQYYDEITSDNIFALAVRKPGVPIKFINLEQEKLEIFKEWHNGFSIALSSDRKIYNPLLNLPPKEQFTSTSGQPLNTFEVSVNLRFAFLEKFFETTFYRTSLGSDFPILSFKYTRGIEGVLNSSYSYDKIFASISDYVKIPPIGSLYYNFFGGQTFGTLPFPLLNVAPGNETYYYNQYAFSLMNKYQYLYDRFIGLNLEHNIGSGLFRFIPITRKLKFRQFWTAKMILGSLSEANRIYNDSPDYTFETINGQPYLELGTGIDNIFKVLRFDFIWRVLPQPLPSNAQQRFGIFGSFRLAF